MSKKSTTDAAVEQKPKGSDAGVDAGTKVEDKVAENLRADSQANSGDTTALEAGKTPELRPLAPGEKERAGSAEKLDPKEAKGKVSDALVRQDQAKEVSEGKEKDRGKLDQPRTVQELEASKLLALFEKQRKLELLKNENPLLSKGEEDRANYLRANLANLAPNIAGFGLEGKLSDKEVEKIPEKWSKMSYTQLLDELAGSDKPVPGLTQAFLERKLRESLALEQEAGVFGPATKKAFESTINWYEKKELPNVMAVAGMLGVKPEAHSPAFIDKEGKSLAGTDAETISVLVAYGLADAKTGLDSKKVPSEEDLDKFDAAFQWMTTMKEKLVKVQLDQAETEINRELDALGLGPEYKRQDGENQAAWVQAATKNVRIITEVRNHMETMLNLYRASDGKFALELPAGKGLHLEYEGKNYEITQKDIVDGKLSADLEKALRFGTLKESRFDFMKDHKASPSNLSMQEALINYLERVNPRVKQGVQEIIRVKENQDSLVVYADQPIESGLARFAKVGLEKALLGQEAGSELLGASKREALYNAYLESNKLSLSPDFRKAVVAGLKWIEANPQDGRIKEKAPAALEEIIKASIAERKDKSDRSLELSGVIAELKRIQEIQNSPGKYLGLADSKTKAGANELLSPANIRAYNFSAEAVTSGEHSGKIRVKQTVQVWNGSAVHYLDLRKLDIPGTDASLKIMDSVGEPTTLREDYLSPNDLVPVRDGASMRLVQAKDLQSFFNSQWRGYYGHKVLTGGMDIVFGAMAVASLVPTAGASGPEAVIAMQAARSGLKTAIGREVAWSQAEASRLMRKQLMNLTLAGTGIFNNTAGYQMKAGDIPIGQYLNVGRSVIFMTHITKGTGEQLWSMGHRGYQRLAQVPWQEAAKAGNLQGMGKTLLEGVRKPLPPPSGPMKGEEALTQILLPSMAQNGRPFWPAVHKWSGIAFQPLTFGLGYSLLGPGGEWSHILAEKAKRDPLSDSVSAYGEGAASFRKSIEKTESKERPSPLAHVAGRISASFQGSDASSRSAQITELSRDLTKMQLSMFSMEKVKQELERAEAAVQSEQPGEVQDKAKLEFEKKKLEYDKAKVQIDESIGRLLNNLNSPDRALAAFSAVSLVYLSRGKDGKIPDSFESKGWMVSKDLVISKLKSEFFNSDLMPHSPAIAESMIDLGLASAAQVAGRYLEKIESSETSRQERVYAMNGLASALAFLKAESLSNSAGDKKAAAIKNFGLTFEDVSAQLKRLSHKNPDSSDSRGALPKVDPEIQAMAAYTLLLSKEPAADELERGLDWLEKTASSISPEKIHEAVSEQLKARLQLPLSKDLHPEIYRFRLVQAATAFAAVVNDESRENQRLSNRAVLESALKEVLATRNSAVSSAMLESLPVLLKQIGDKDLGKNLVKSAISYSVAKSANKEQESLNLANLNRLKDLLLNRDFHEYNSGLLSHFEDKLLSLIDPRRPEFARLNPRLRVSALEALSVVGSSRASEVMRLSVSAAPFKLSGEIIEAGESNAAVRLAAIRALERAGDSEFTEMVNALLAKESDAAAYSVLQELQLSAGLPLNTDPRELERQTAAALLNLRNKFPHLSPFDASAAQAWLKQKFELLDAVTFAQLYKSEATNAGSFFKWIDRKVVEQIAPKEYLAVTEKIKADYLIKQRREQFDSLLNMARGNDAEADYARMALFYIASENASPLTHGGSDVVVKGNYYNGKVADESMQVEAARVLTEGSKPGSHSQALSLALSQIGAGSPNDLVRTEFLKAFEEQEDLGRIESAPKLRMLLNEELSRPAGLQSPLFQEKLVKIIGKLPFRVAEPILEKVINTSPFQEIRQGAAFYFPGPTRIVENGLDQQPFGVSAAKDWLKAEFPLLNLPDYISEFNKTAAGRPNWSERNIPHTLRWLYDYTLPTVEKIESDAGSETRALRRKQFADLLDLASKAESPDSEKARYALYYIANNAGFILGKDGQKFDVSGNYYQGSDKNRDFQVQAAKKLMSLFKNAATADSDLGKMVGEGLSNATDPSIRLSYLKGLNEVLDKSKEKSESAGIVQSVEKILNSALLSEVRRPPAQQDAKFQMALIDSLARRADQAIPLLRTLSKRAVKAEIRQHAAEAVSRLEAQQAPF